MAKATLYTPHLIDRYLQSGEWTRETLSEIWDRNAERYSDNEAVVDSQTRLTWGQAKKWIDRLALSLLEAGLKKDDLVVLQLPNCVELMVLIVACEKAGLLSLPVLRTFRHNEMDYIIRHVHAAAVVIPIEFRGFDYFAMIRAIQRNADRLKHVFFCGADAPDGYETIAAMAADPVEERYPRNFLADKTCPPTDVSLVVSTSGTTGFPKFVEYPIAARFCSARGRVKKYHYTTEDTFGIFGAGIGTAISAYFAAPLAGAKIVMMEHFEAEAALKLVQDERISVIGAAPAILTMMVRHPDFAKYDLSSLRLVESAGAPLPYEDGREIEENMGCTVVQRYSSMDAGMGFEGIPDDPLDIRLRYPGRPFAGTEIKLVDANGREVAVGEVGRILLRGPSGSSGYYLDPETTRQKWSADGWHDMGDLGRINEQGYLNIVGREKDIIIRGGQNIYPIEIENMLAENPKVVEAAIVGMPDPVMGEKACAYVVVKPGGTLSFEEMIAYLDGREVAKYKFPERLEIIDHLPLLPGVSKVDKKVLVRDIARKLKGEGR